MSKHIFLSYSSEDRTCAEDICRILEESGIDCWIAPRDIEPGKNYAEEIIHAIKTTHAMVLVLSEYSNNSTHVRNEVERAVSKGKTIFPVRVREVQPSKALELFIAASQWVDAFTPPLEEKVDKLSAAIKGLLSLDVERDMQKEEKPVAAAEDAKTREDQPTEPVSRETHPSTPTSPPDMKRFKEIPGRQIKTGFSILTSVIDQETGEMCLLKRMPKEQADQLKGNFSHLRIDESSIANPLQQWESEDSYLELLPMVDGWTFAEIMSLNKGVFGEYLTHWCFALLNIVKALQEHDPPLIHRDITPANVMVRKDNLSSLVLIDCTTMVSFPVPEGIVPVGTPGYSAPEAMSSSLTLASDIYSVGCTIYALNRGESPPTANQIRYFGKEMSLINEEYVVQSIFSRLVELDPSKRLPDAAAALAAVKHDDSTRVMAKFGDLILPDGRKLEQIGFG